MLRRWRTRWTDDRRERQRLAIPSDDEFIDPRYDFSDPEEEHRRQAFIRENERDAAGLLAELRTLGFDGLERGFGLLIHAPHPSHAPTIPVLLKWLPTLEREANRESVVRALAVPWAAPEAIPVLLHESEDPRWSDDYRQLVGDVVSMLVNEQRR